MLLEFYGAECPHCDKVNALIKQLEKETGRSVKKLEVWHNAPNAKKLEQYDKGLCGGVPFFFNTNTNDFICGATYYERLRQWAENI